MYLWLFSEDPEVAERAVGRVAAWKARAVGSLPAAVEMTADIVECQLSERRMKRCIFHEVRLCYSMAITRCVAWVCVCVRE